MLGIMGYSHILMGERIFTDILVPKRMGYPVHSCPLLQVMLSRILMMNNCRLSAPPDLLCLGLLANLKIDRGTPPIGLQGAQKCCDQVFPLP
jgi:hypothetical protein